MENQTRTPSSKKADDYSRQIEEETIEKNIQKRERSLVFYEESLSRREKELSQRETEVVMREKEWDQSRVGTKVRRYFPNVIVKSEENAGKMLKYVVKDIWIDGIVTKWFPYDEVTGDEALWHVSHTDFDEEDLNETELLQAITDYNHL